MGEANSMDRRPTTQDVSWFLDQARSNQLDLEPTYQRKSVWSLRDRRYFLDTIFRGYPSPAIFLHKRSEDDGRHIYEVVDGKQRLETILRFANDKIAIDKEFGNARFNGKKWKDLDPKQRRRFWDYVLPVEMIKMVEGTVVNEVFERLNRNSRKLERQELRHARNDGWLISFVDKEAEQEELWKTFKVSTPAKSRRMKDAQFLSELLLVLLKDEVAGFDQDALDQAYSDYDAPELTDPDFDADAVVTRFAQIKDYLRRMDKKNGCVQEYAETATNLYSLWAWAALTDPLPKAGAAALRYANLMERVQEWKSEPDLEAVRQTDAAADDSYRYALNSTGASTEPAQRQARHEVLTRVLGK